MTFRSKYGEPTEELKWKKYRIKVFQTHTHTLDAKEQNGLLGDNRIRTAPMCNIDLSEWQKKNTFASNLFNSQQEGLKRFYMMNMTEQNIKLFK